MKSIRRTGDGFHPGLFTGEADGLEKQTETVSQTLQNVFDFMEAAFGDSQEMVAFITELNNCASHSRYFQ